MDREAKQILELIIKPTLKLIGMTSPSALILMTYTGQTESGYDALRQVLPSGNYGPAYGWWQMQENAYNQVISYLNRRDNERIKRSILAACYLDILPPFETLIWNVRFACCAARVQYWQNTEPLPRPDDFDALADYYLKYYNRGGKGTLEKFKKDCKDLIPISMVL